MKNYIRINQSNQNIELIYGKSYDTLKNMDGSICAVDSDGEYILVAEENLGQFHCTTISREDFIYSGFDASKLTDAQMCKISKTISEIIYDNYMSDIIVDIANDMNIKQIEIEEEKN